MSRSRRSRTLALGIGADDMTLLASRTAPPLACVPLVAEQKEGQAALSVDWNASVAALLAQRPARESVALDATVADSWCHYWIQPVPEGVARFDELRALAAARLESLFGVRAEAWEIAADWKLSGLMLACAMPLKLVEALRNPPAGAWSLASLRPGSVRALARHASRLPASGWALSVARGSVTFFQFEHHQVCHVRRHPVLGQPGLATIQSLLEAEMLRRDALAGKTLHLIGGRIDCAPGQSIAGLRLVIPGASAAEDAESLTLGLQGIGT